MRVSRSPSAPRGEKQIRSIVCMIFYPKAHRPIYRDKLNIDVKQLNSEIEERMAQLRENPDLFARAMRTLKD